MAGQTKQVINTKSTGVNHKNKAQNTEPKQPSLKLQQLKNTTRKPFKGWMSLLKIGLATLAVAGSSGIVLGVTAFFNHSVRYLDYTPYKNLNPDVDKVSLWGNKDLFNSSYWAGHDHDDHPVSEPDTSSATGKKIYDALAINSTLTEADPEQLYKYAELVIDGSKHEVLDSSFNQSQYNGLVNWVHQKDNTIEGKKDWTVGSPSVVTIKDKVENPISFNVKEKGIKGNYIAKAARPTGDTPKKFEETYTNIFSDPENADLRTAILSGFLHSESGLWGADKYPEKGFIIVDSIINRINVASIQARSDQGAFLAAMSACQFLQDNYDRVYSKVNNGKLAVGTFGGLPIPSVTAFMGGFEIGVWVYNHFVLPKLEGYDSWTQEMKNKRTVGLIDLGEEDSFFTNSFSIGDAGIVTRELLAQGADVILPVAGPQTIDVIKEIEAEASPAVAIGVDVAQEDTKDGSKLNRSPLWKNKNQKIVLCSVVRETEMLISMMLQASAKGIRGYSVNIDATTPAERYKEIPWSSTKTPATGSFIGTYGYVTIGDINNYGVNVSDAGKDNFLKAMNLILAEGEKVSDYQAALKVLSTKELIDNLNSKNPKKVTILQALNDNKAFWY